eukprot:1090407-Rhodomonas_salina.1
MDDAGDEDDLVRPLSPTRQLRMRGTDAAYGATSSCCGCAVLTQRMALPGADSAAENAHAGDRARSPTTQR